jgi:GR25 family glycosyltransferase involved in LPS biosynthesis
MSSLLQASSLIHSSYATSFRYVPVSKRLRIELNPGDQKTRIVALAHFQHIILWVEGILEKCFKRSRKWTSVYIEDGTKLRLILVNIKSICARTLLSPSDITSKSPLELSRFLANPSNTHWDYKTLNEIFPHITLITLKESQQRQDSFREHLQIIGEHNLKYDQLNGIDASKLPQKDCEQMSKSNYAKQFGKDDRTGRYGCFLSHLEALKKARNEKKPQILILEDDVRFAPEALTGPDLQKTLKELPANWGILFLGAQELDPKHSKDYSTHLYKPSYPVDLHAYVVNASMYEPLITALEKELTKAPGTTRAIDAVIAEEFCGHDQNRIFTCKTNVAFQDEGYSRILNKVYTAYPNELQRYRNRFTLNNPNRERSADGLPIMSPLLAGTLYQMTYALSKAFNQCGIRYWADGGTLLGQQRHQGLIPHDDDVDLWVHPDDIEKLTSEPFKTALQASGLELVNHWIGAKVCARKDHPLGYIIDRDGLQFRTPNIDLFFSEKKTTNGQVTYTLKSPEAQKCWPNYSHEHSNVFDENDQISQAPFGPIMLNSIKDRNSFCKRFYGDACFKEAYQQYNHLQERGVEKRPVQITDFRPPKWEEWKELPPLPTAPSNM